MKNLSTIADARLRFHATLLNGVLTTNGGIPSNADKDNTLSVAIAAGIAKRLGIEVETAKQPGQTSGIKFEKACAEFLSATFLELGHLRPGQWQVHHGKRAISHFEQYSHLSLLSKIAESNSEVAVALGADYLIKPDISISRQPVPDSQINATKMIVDEDVATHTPLREANSPQPILHAIVSCKWTIRSDRAQNARSEALNLVKNRKGPLPHIAVIIGEPLPSRIASIALGTGEIDCVYHFALHELQDTLVELKLDDARDMVNTMVEGKRLRDISDLPLDMAI